MTGVLSFKKINNFSDGSLEQTSTITPLLNDVSSSDKTCKNNFGFERMLSNTLSLNIKTIILNVLKREVSAGIR